MRIEGDRQTAVSAMAAPGPATGGSQARGRLDGVVERSRG
jgi:hypothetical protein